MSKERKNSERKDGRLIRGLDPMHAFMPYLLPDRTANEAVMNELIDMTEVKRYVAAKNAENPEFKYTVFHVISAAIAKTIALRPKLNYYIINYKYYERNNISLAFVVKRKFADDSSESLAIVTFDPDSDEAPIDRVYEKIKKIVYRVRREDKSDGATDIMSVLTKLPKFLLKLIIGILNFMDAHNLLPEDLIKEDPYHCSAFLSNLGSIKMSASYHHLTNWGTNSFFAIIGEMHKHPFYNEDGSFEVRDALTLGLTIDERIADGLYFANSIKLLKKLLSEPELLEKPIKEKIIY